VVILDGRLLKQIAIVWDRVGIFGPGIFLGFVGSPRDFLGFEFCPHSIIPGHFVHCKRGRMEQGQVV